MDGLKGYIEIVRNSGEADLQFHLLLEDGEEVGGAMMIEYCPFCGGKAIECKCQSVNFEKMKQEVEEKRRTCGREVSGAEGHD